MSRHTTYILATKVRKALKALEPIIKGAYDSAFSMEGLQLMEVVHGYDRPLHTYFIQFYFPEPDDEMEDQQLIEVHFGNMGLQYPVNREVYAKLLKDLGLTAAADKVEDDLPY